MVFKLPAEWRSAGCSFGPLPAGTTVGPANAPLPAGSRACRLGLAGGHQPAGLDRRGIAEAAVYGLGRVPGLPDGLLQPRGSSASAPASPLPDESTDQNGGSGAAFRRK